MWTEFPHIRLSISGWTFSESFSQRVAVTGKHPWRLSSPSPLLTHLTPWTTSSRVFTIFNDGDSATFSVQHVLVFNQSKQSCHFCVSTQMNELCFLFGWLFFSVCFFMQNFRLSFIYLSSPIPWSRACNLASKANMSWINPLFLWKPSHKRKKMERECQSLFVLHRNFSSIWEKKKKVSFSFLNLPAIRHFRRPKDRRKHAYSTCIAPCQVTGTVRKPVEGSLKAEVWSWLQKWLQLGLPYPQESPVTSRSSAPCSQLAMCLPHDDPWTAALTASWPRACPMMIRGWQPIKPKQTGAKRGPAWHIDPPVWGLLVPLISSDQKHGLHRVERLCPCHIGWFGATKAPQQQIKCCQSLVTGH